MSGLTALVSETVRERGLLLGGESVLCMLSGGRDSTAMLDCLCRLSGEYDLSLSALHVNYGLRGTDSDGDEAFVRELCVKYSVPLTVRRLEAAESEALKRGSLQAEARRLRYEAAAAAALPGGLIAVGHTADDRAETVVFRLLRGAGPAGLAVMLPKAPCPCAAPDGSRPAVIRPLIGARREDTTGHCREAGIGWRDDESNESPLYARNRIRNEMMPALQAVQPGAVDALCAFADMAAEDEAAAGHIAGSLLERQGDGLSMGIEVFRRLPEDVRRSVVRAAFRTAGATGTPGRAFISEVIGLSEADAGCPSLAGLGVRVSAAYGRISFGPTGEGATLEEREMTGPGRLSLPEIGKVLVVEEASGPPAEWPHGENEAWLDADRLAFPLTVRARMPGDRMMPLGLGGWKKLQDVMVDGKVPALERERVPIVLSGEAIAWVPGLGPDDRFRVRPETGRILRLTIKDGPR